MLRTKKRINELRLFAEMDKRVYEIKRSMVKDKRDAERVLYADRYVELFKDFIKNTASEHEVKEWEKGRDRFYEVMGYLSNMLSFDNIFERAKRT